MVEQTKQIENELERLTHELDACNIPHVKRMEHEKTLGEYKQEFQKQGGYSQQLEKKLLDFDRTLAFEVITQAENEISKAEHEGSHFQGIENVRRDLEENKITPIHARHEVKNIMRKT